MTEAHYFISDLTQYRSIPVSAKSRKATATYLLDMGFEAVDSRKLSIPGKGEIVEVYWQPKGE